MSFAQQLGRTTASAQDDFLQKTMRKFTAECQSQAALGHSRCDIYLEQPSWFNEVKQRFEERLKEMGFQHSFVQSSARCDAKGYEFRLYAQWALEGQHMKPQ